jgi:hypothetical protein
MSEEDIFSDSQAKFVFLKKNFFSWKHQCLCLHFFCFQIEFFFINTVDL